MDTSTPLSQIEAGRIITIMRGKGIRMKYRELMGFSPAEISKLPVGIKNRLKADDIALAAGRGKNNS